VSVIVPSTSSPSSGLPSTLAGLKNDSGEEIFDDNGDNDNDHTICAAYYSRRWTSFSYSSTTLPPTRILSLKSASGSNLRKRGQNSGRSISSLLELAGLASGTTDASTVIVSGETSLTCNLSLPPSQRRVALVTAERSEEIVSSAFTGGSGARNQTRARTVGGESEKPVWSRTHGPNANGVRRMTVCRMCMLILGLVDGLCLMTDDL
jgi:hypothetical protein